MLGTRQYLNEKIEIITPDGLVYNLHNPPRSAVLSVTGLGHPEATISTTTAPYQHGETPISYRFEPRIINISLRHQEFNRSDYWTRRSILIDRLGLQRTNANRTEPSTLRFTYIQDGVLVVREIDVLFNGGLIYDDPSPNWDSYSIQEDLEFIAHDPIFRDPAPITVSLIQDTNYVYYTGTWETYPIIHVTGPATDFIINNYTTSGLISLTGASGYSISAGAVITIDCTPGSRNIYSIAEPTLLGYLSSQSRMNNFVLKPSPHLVNGNNWIIVDYASGSPTVSMTYYNMYTGI